MDPLNISLLLIACFTGLWSVFYARRAYQNTKKILDKVDQ